MLNRAVDEAEADALHRAADEAEALCRAVEEAEAEIEACACEQSLASLSCEPETDIYMRSYIGHTGPLCGPKRGRAALGCVCVCGGGGEGERL